jgi:hypothetical protein
LYKETCRSEAQNLFELDARQRGTMQIVGKDLKDKDTCMALRMKGNHHAKGLSIKFERGKAVLKASVTRKTDGAHSL